MVMVIATWISLHGYRYMDKHLSFHLGCLSVGSGIGPNQCYIGGREQKLTVHDEPNVRDRNSSSTGS